jgi:hypothetical protein
MAVANVTASVESGGRILTKPSTALSAKVGPTRWRGREGNTGRRRQVACGVGARDCSAGSPDSSCAAGSHHSTDQSLTCPAGEFPCVQLAGFPAPRS